MRGTLVLMPSRFSGNIDAFVEGSKHMAESGTYSSHTFQPVEVHFDDSGSKALAFSTGSVTIRLMFEGIEYDMVSWVRFVSMLQKFEKVGWRLLTLEAIYDRDTVAPTKPAVALSQPPVIDTTGFRASYKYLTWALTLRGYNIAQDLPGTDDEKSMKKCVDAGYSWLNGSA
jgi:hypothetical protein